VCVCCKTEAMLNSPRCITHLTEQIIKKKSK